jgi:hypothetical protein
VITVGSISRAAPAAVFPCLAERFPGRRAYCRPEALATPGPKLSQFLRWMRAAPMVAIRRGWTYGKRFNQVRLVKGVPR